MGPQIISVHFVPCKEITLKSTVEQLSPTRVRINVEVPFDELKPNFDRAYRKLAQQVRIPGFRPGKVPARVLESRIGRAPILDEVVNEAIPAKYMEAVNKDSVRALAQPNIEVTRLEDGTELAFTAEVDVRPDITIPAFDQLEVTVDEVTVSDEDVQIQLDELRARFGTLTGVDRAVENGDFVVVDLSATVNGEAVPDAETTGLSYEVGSGQLVEGMDDALVGAKAGEAKTFTTKLVAGEHIGRDAEVTAVITTVKERQLPEADDEFAQMASEFDTLDELKDDLRTRVTKVKTMEQGVQAREKVLEALLDSIEVPLPEAVVTAEVDNRKHDAIHVFEHNQERFEEWLASQDQTPEEFDTEVRAAAEKSVKTQLVLDSIAETEKVTLTEAEFSERVLYQAQSYGMDPREYINQVQQAGQLPAVYADARRGKALIVVLRGAKVTDSQGNDVNLDELLGPAKTEAVTA